MKTKDPHWTFHTAVLLRALKDLETACTAAPDSSEFEFFRGESPDIVEEAREALSALERYLQTYDKVSSANIAPPTQH